ncbi:MAG TPA: hypothetical protein VGO31_10325 [Microbacteriaceae bacterium]|jgi:hypothetical protein|nr:hypothetical protein [Microbacteriaceae bacterium]
MTDHDEPLGTAGLAHLFVPIYLQVDPGNVLSEARSLARHVGQRAELLALDAAGWEINLDEFDDTVADFSAKREFDSLRAAIEAGLEVGAAGRMLEWAEELDYYCVGESRLD